ncbi:diiron oxygenase [uncultured Aeromicrobium sp.]|uniref:AurF N-oxygenase family protein n=1 Tax=uncultured Aeromicrobium sp. TaxID=337820 RepID=UPI0025D5DBE6|nr:diiron oxygenase [uncultured Aeromicrobium sp.]
MTATAVEFRQQIDPDGTLERLLESAATLSYDPDEEIDWDAPLDPTKYGLNPEWSTLYGTRLWSEMTEQQRIALTRHEVGSIMSTGIWFEMILQQMVLRDQYCGAYGGPEFQFALTEIADECRHSLMFAKTCAKLGVPHYKPKRHVQELARGLKTLAGGEIAYGGILVAEEILDVMQRDWMRGENVLHEVRTTSKIHVVEEARHMKFARHEIREHLKDAGPLRRKASATFIAGAAKFVVESMVSDEVYANVGLDRDRAVAEAKANTHHHNLMRMSCVHLMDFLSEAGLLTPYAMRLYRSVHML